MASVTTNRGKKATTWSVLWRDPQGARNRETFKRADAARRFKAWIELHPAGTLAEWEAEIGLRAPLSRKSADGPTIAELYRLWVDGRDVGVSKSRRETDDSLFRIQLKSLHGTGIRDLTVSAVRAWRSGLQRTPHGKLGGRTGKAALDEPCEICGEDLTHGHYSPATIGAARTVLRSIVQMAMDDRIIGSNPVDSVDGPDVDRPELTADDVFTVAELEAFLKCVPMRWRALFAVMGYTGCRLSEALGLTPNLLDLTGDGVAHFGIQRVQEVGGRPVLRPGAKTRGSKRDPWLGPEVVEYLTAHLERYPTAPDELIFRTETGAIPNRSNLLKRQFRPALAAAGIAKDMDVMNLRHTAISHMLAADIQVVNVAARVGHANPNETLRTYARFIPHKAGTNPDMARMAAWRDAQK